MVWTLTPLGNAVLAGPEALFNLVGPWGGPSPAAVGMIDGVEAEGTAGKRVDGIEAQEMAGGMALVAGEIVRNRIGPQYAPRHLIASALHRIFQSLDMEPSWGWAARLLAMVRLKQVSKEVIPYASKARYNGICRYCVVCCLQEAAEIFTKFVSAGEFERAAMEAVVRANAETDHSAEMTTGWRVRRIVRYPSSASLADVDFLERQGRRASVNNEEEPFFIALDVIATDHPDETMRQMADAAGTRLNEEMTLHLRTALTGLKNVNTETVRDELEKSRVRRPKNRSRLYELVLILLIHGTDEDVLFLLHHPSPEIRGMAIFNMAQSPGWGEKLAKLWKHEREAIERDMGSSDGRTQEEAIGELGLFAGLGVEEAIRRLIQVARDSGNPGLQRMVNERFWKTSAP